MSRKNDNNDVILISMFHERLPDRTIINLATGGANSNYGISILNTSKLPSNAIVVVSFGTNDAAYWKMVSIKDYKNNLEKIIKKLDVLGNKVVLVSPPPVNLQKQTPPGRKNEVIKKYAETMHKIAKAHNLLYLNLYELLHEEMQESDIHFKDGVHLNELGYDIFFNKLVNLLK